MDREFLKGTPKFFVKVFQILSINAFRGVLIRKAAAQSGGGKTLGKTFGAKIWGFVMITSAT